MLSVQTTNSPAVVRYKHKKTHTYTHAQHMHTYIYITQHVCKGRQQPHKRYKNSSRIMAMDSTKPTQSQTYLTRAPENGLANERGHFPSVPLNIFHHRFDLFSIRTPESIAIRLC
eukprot:Opistho-2@95066